MFLPGHSRGLKSEKSYPQITQISQIRKAKRIYFLLSYLRNLRNLWIKRYPFDEAMALLRRLIPAHACKIRVSSVFHPWLLPLFELWNRRYLKIRGPVPLRRRCRRSIHPRPNTRRACPACRPILYNSVSVNSSRISVFEFRVLSLRPGGSARAGYSERFCQDIECGIGLYRPGRGQGLKAAGKDVVELEIGDSPFESTASAKAAGVRAIEEGQSHYCPSPGLPAFRAGPPSS